jgi:tRNA dimethylallyltransferase
MRPIIHIAGPTASGKSALAERLCAQFDAELISVDSVLIYRGMDIGSAKPGLKAIQDYRYHLIDILDPEQSYSAAQFFADATRLIADIRARGRLPILVGGTMLYLRTLTHGISNVPSTDPELRAALQLELAQRGLAAMHAELASVDPKAAQRIHANDPQRTLRALEVFRQTGIPLSDQQHAWQQDVREEANVLRFALYPDRAVLHQRIALRFQAMLEAGFLDEVRLLMQRPGLSVDHSSMRAVGYRQAWEHLRGDYDQAQFLERGIAATRQLAKRQITWIRSDPGLLRLEGNEQENLDLIANAIGTLATQARS